MFEPLIVFVFGLIIGSFCNVVIYRLPVGESIITPGSRCRACSAPIRPWDNIPVLSYLLLAARCRACGEHISLRYPCVELVMGGLYILLWLKLGVSLPLVGYALLNSTLVIVALIDLDHQIIPNIITYPGMVVGLGLSFRALPLNPLMGSPLLASLVGLLAGGIFFYAVALVSRGGMGGGDIKLIAMIGAFLGWQGTLFTILVGALTGSLVGIALMLLGKKGRRDKVPFGPFLSLGAIVFTLLGDDLIDWYVRLAF
ncbi:MAG: prepilin peptidase [Nitrospinae bacterium]|nr:prepilin peptidase [Nitrospinota bacterium]